VNLTQHKANVLDVGVQWKQCPRCDFKAKKNSNLNQHIKSQHTSK